MTKLALASWGAVPGRSPIHFFDLTLNNAPALRAGQNETPLVTVATHTAENEPSKVFSEMRGSTVAVSGVILLACSPRKNASVHLTDCGGQETRC